MRQPDKEDAMRAVKFTHNLRDIKRFMSFAAFLATLLFSMTFVTNSSAAVVAANNPVVANPVVMTVAPLPVVMTPVPPIMVMTPAPPAVAKSDAAFVRPFGFNPFFRPFAFRPFFNPFFFDVDVDPFFGAD
jgi:hypothetical protein